MTISTRAVIPCVCCMPGWGIAVDTAALVSIKTKINVSTQAQNQLLLPSWNLNTNIPSIHTGNHIL